MRDFRLIGLIFAATAALSFGRSAQAAYWNVFNIEGESTVTADIVTYATLDDMLHDTNRTGDISPNSLGFGRNVVGSGSDNFPSVTPGVPEPQTWGLLVLGFVGLGAMRRRSRSRAHANGLLFSPPFF